MTQETNDVVTQELIERLLRFLDALAGDCDNTDGWEDAAPTVREAGDALQSQSARIAELEGGIADFDRFNREELGYGGPDDVALDPAYGEAWARLNSLTKDSTSG